ncbi:DoxX family protein [Haloarcula laminariae]|uniref:DoxX family protein n=1 Tax=Haloarcula laminariae TaxID=2961577 RepID=UPI002404C72D|nr:DoxX family protein [Halomicroarcula sp. FL173]
MIGAVIAGLVSLVGRPVRAHVDYVTDSGAETLDPVAFTTDVLSDPFNAGVFLVSGLAVTVGIAAYLWVRPTVTDIVVLREKLASYADLVPWMLRLAVGLPLIGAGFEGYLFAPTVTFNLGANPLLRVLFIGLGFAILFGLATRIAATVGLVTYGWALASEPGVFLAVEYVPIFLALFVLGGGRPSADDMLLEVASTDGSLYGRIDPVHHLKSYLDERTRPLRPYVPVILRVGMGVSFIYLGLIQKLAQPSSGLAVVEKYNLTAVVPVDPGLWVVGAGVTEIAVGVALIAGFFIRGAAATSFVLFTVTLFGLPDDPVLAHVALFGMASAVFTLGAGPLSFDRWFGRPAVGEDESVVPAD